MCVSIAKGLEGSKSFAVKRKSNKVLNDNSLIVAKKRVTLHPILVVKA